MEEQQNRRVPKVAIAVVSAVVLAAGGGWAWWFWQSGQSPPQVQNLPQAQITPSTQPVPSTEKTVNIYWLKDTGQRLEVVPSPIKIEGSNNPDAILTGAFKTLLSGPTDSKLATTIPSGTKLRSVRVRQDGIHVDLSSEFTSGGGSASMTGRVAQVIYTATSLKPGDRVWIDVDGKRLEVLGGEGLELEQPLTRKSFEENFEL
ncbi:MAG: GerMN domain-containing protein [Cyanosarcina radialis HA8281-LM2]|jgi:spore germination protein GerM|nr:GerMN domain-containing protein [Cyanosarcina radialis HA8281-LM2]